VAEVSQLESTQQARAAYEEHKATQRHHLAPAPASPAASAPTSAPTSIPTREET
jgi:hypothetical protein